MNSDRYLSSDYYIGSHHSFAISAKIQSRKQDNPNYNDVIQSLEEERTPWESSMVKELKSLRELGSFKMMTRPRGSNILQYTWSVNS